LRSSPRNPPFLRLRFPPLRASCFLTLALFSGPIQNLSFPFPPFSRKYSASSLPLVYVIGFFFSQTTKLSMFPLRDRSFPSLSPPPRADAEGKVLSPPLALDSVPLPFPSGFFFKATLRVRSFSFRSQAFLFTAP